MARLKTLKSRVTMAPTARVKVVTPASWRSGKSSAERGYGYRWQKARADYLQKNPLCSMCTAEGAVCLATVVDHIRPHQGDKALFWDKANWQPLCAKHHDRDKAKEERAAGLR